MTTTDHILQSRAWGDLKTAFGWRAQNVDTPSGRALVLFRTLPPVPAALGTIAYVPRGPTLDWHDPAAVRATLAALDQACRRQHAICLKLEPWLEDDPATSARFTALGLRPSPHTVQTRRTLLVDLRGTPDELLARMHPKCRYNVRLASRKGVTVRAATHADLPTFHALTAATSARDGFSVHTPAYYEKAFDTLIARDNLGALLLAEADGQALAALFVVAQGPLALYLYGASADVGRERMPTYLLQWEAMQWARARNCTTYDLLGVPDEDEATLEAQFESRHDGLWGVYRFKRGFGGRLMRTVGAWDRVYNPPLYALYRWISARRASAE